MRLWSLVIAATFAVALAACNSQQAPAEAAVKAAQDAFAPLSADAQKYVPDQAKAIQESITQAQTDLSNKDYAGALTAAQAIPAQITALSGAISAKKAQLTTQWTAMTAGVPKLMEALKSRVTTLSASKHLPASISADALKSAQTTLASSMQGWSDATAAATSGDMATAMSKAGAVKDSIVAAMKGLNMQVPAGAGGN